MSIIEEVGAGAVTMFYAFSFSSSHRLLISTADCIALYILI